MKNKHRIKQGLSLLLVGALTFSNVGTALPAFAEDAPATPETASAATPETAEANVPTPNLSQITENLYDDLPDAPTGSYLGSMGLPVATGETKIGISAWVSDLYDGVDAHMDADALNADENTVTIGKTPGTDYAIVPLLAQVEYPADGAVSEIILPDGVELLSYRSTDYEPIPADEQEQTEILHQTYSEQSAAATGLYVKASADFTVQLVYTDSDGSSQSKSIHVQISEDAAPTQMYADTGDDGIAAYAAGPTPPYTTGKITSIAKEGGTWLIWFNGQEAYCCSHGLNGQPKGCPTYNFSHVSRLEPGQYTPGNHYANQVNIWGGLGQLSLDMLDDRPVVASLEDDPEGCEEQPDILGSLYDETQQWIMENYPDSYAAQTYIAAAEELVNGTDAQSGENGYYTYIYNPPAGYAWQVVALVGEEIAGGTEIPDVPSVPEPKYYSAAWTAPAQTAVGSFDLTFTVNTDKVQLNTLEKVDGAVITVTPSRTGGSVDGGSWQMTPAGAQTITTSGHTQDDSFHVNGGDGSATWTVHYEVSKTSTSTLSGQEGPFTSQAEADAAAEAAKNAAIGQLQNEAQGMVDAAIASARAQLANITFPPRVKMQMDNRKMAEEIVRLVGACHGHALVLFTSYRQMAEVRALTDGQWPYPTYQAWRNGGKIIQKFKQSSNGVLFAAGSCWEGIDFPGDMVSLLIIAKLPFPIPDPVSNYERQKYPTLQEYIAVEIIPEMQKKLRQGFGRAIRTEQDSCVVAILDERAGIGGRYHDAALAALPTCLTTEKIEDVQQFIREQKHSDYFL